MYVAAEDSPFAGLSARAAARTLRRGGVRYAVFPPGYPYRTVFARSGVVSPPLAPLYRATAAQIARRYMAQLGIVPCRATIAFIAGSATPELCRCAEALCADVRYVVLSVPRGGEPLAEALRRKHGVAARVCAPDALLRADLAVVFDGAAAEQPALCLDESLCVAYESDAPNELLAALWQIGALDPHTLRVKEVTRPPA